jgi:hypothetical protein
MVFENFRRSSIQLNKSTKCIRNAQKYINDVLGVHNRRDIQAVYKQVKGQIPDEARDENGVVQKKRLLKLLFETRGKNNIWGVIQAFKTIESAAAMFDILSTQESQESQESGSSNSSDEEIDEDDGQMIQSSDEGDTVEFLSNLVSKTSSSKRRLAETEEPSSSGEPTHGNVEQPSVQRQGKRRKVAKDDLVHKKSFANLLLRGCNQVPPVQAAV